MELGFGKLARGRAADQVRPLSSEYETKIFAIRVRKTIISLPSDSSARAFSISQDPFVVRYPKGFQVAPLNVQGSHTGRLV